MQNLRDTYLANSISTATPAQMLLMLCDRMVLDVQRAAEAQAAQDFAAATKHLMHAQDVVSYLKQTLRTDMWDGAQTVSDLYDFLYGKLVEANINRDVQATSDAMVLAADIADMWRAAAETSSRESALVS